MLKSSSSYIFSIIYILLLLVQKKNQENDTRATWSCGHLVLLDSFESLKTRSAQTGSNSFFERICGASAA
jgi:hypothetical protein